MSLRNNAYHSRGGGDLSTGGGGSGLLGLLGNLLGDQTVSGGPRMADPESGESVNSGGELLLEPYQGKKGFFNRVGRNRAASLNEGLMGDAYERQEEGKQAKDLLKAKGTQEKELVRERGVADENLVKIKQAAELMLKDGVAYTPETFAKYVSETADTRTRTAGQKAKLDLGVSESPDFARANAEGSIAGARMPVGQLSKLLQLGAGQNEMAVQPDWQGIKLPSILYGGTQNPSTVQEVGGMTLPNGMRIPGKPEVVPGGSRPGRFVQPVDPSVRNALIQKFNSGSGISEGEGVMKQSGQGLNLGVDSDAHNFGGRAGAMFGATPLVKGAVTSTPKLDIGTGPSGQVPPTPLLNRSGLIPQYLNAEQNLILGGANTIGRGINKYQQGVEQPVLDWLYKNLIGQ